MKLQVLISDELTERLDKLAKYVGSSRSAVCGAIIVKSLPEWEKIYNTEPDYCEPDYCEPEITFEQYKIDY